MQSISEVSELIFRILLQRAHGSLLHRRLPQQEKFEFAGGERHGAAESLSEIAAVAALALCWLSLKAFFLSFRT